MKKLFRITTYPISLQRLLRGQHRFFSRHFECVAISNPGSELAEIQAREGIRTIGIPMTRQITPFQDLRSLLHMTWLFLKEKPDIVHTHTPKAGLIGMLAAWLTRRPQRIHTVAGLPLMATQGIKKQLLINIEKLTYASATTVIPNSRGLHRYLIDHKLCNPKKILFIEPGSSNGIDLDYFSRKEVTPAFSNKTPESGVFTFIFIGRLVKDKGIEELTLAFTRLADALPQIRLQIVGDFDHGLNPIAPTVKDVLQQHPQITMFGFQSDIRPFLASSDILVLPSYREGLPQVLLQACAMDVPCIATKIVGCLDIVNDQNGRLIEPRSVDALYAAIKEAYMNPEQVQKWKEQARNSVTHYAQERLWETLLKVYKKDPL